MSDIIILPGIGGSADEHWQTIWEGKDPRMRRFRPRDWDQPDIGDWLAALEREVADSAAPPLVVAHSLACLLVPRWAVTTSFKLRGALLVAVPDPRSAAFPAEASDFSDPPRESLPFPSILVASSNDPFGSRDYAAGRAAQWGSRLVEIGAAGHINAGSGLGAWPEGRVLLETLERETAYPLHAMQ